MADEFSRGRSNRPGADKARANGDPAGSRHNAAEVHHAGWPELARQARSPHPLEQAQARGASGHPDRESETSLGARAQAVLVEVLLRGLERDLERDRRERGQRKDSEDSEDSEDSKDSEDSESSEDSQDSKNSENSKEPKKEERTASPGRKRLFVAVAIVAVLLLALGATLFWLHARHYESTDDAFIDANQSQVGSQIAGRVEQILVADNQHVEAGQALITLDSRDQQAKLEQARAAAGNARAQAQQTRADLILQGANIAQQQAQVKVAQAELEHARRDLERYQSIDPAAVTRQQLDQQLANVKSDSAKLEAAKQAVEGARAQAESQQAKISAADAQAKEADAEVQAAELTLSYTGIVAPTAGRITRRTVNLGNFVQPGQALLAVVPDQMWVTANFKETQLTRMREGQPVEIRVDAFSSQALKGHVDSIQRGTGAVFSSLPAENATGNYVKVVQRVPVKIVFDGEEWKKLPLAPGMSVSPRVTVR